MSIYRYIYTRIELCVCGGTAKLYRDIYIYLCEVTGCLNTWDKVEGKGTREIGGGVQIVGIARTNL